MTKDPTRGEFADGEDLPETGAPQQGAPAPAPQTGANASDEESADQGGAEVEESGAEVEEGDVQADELAKVKSEMLEMADQLARAKADIYNAEQRHKAYVQRTRTEIADARQRGREDVVEALIGVLDDVELARQHGELHGPFKSIAEKLEQTLAQNFEVERFGATGDEFDPNIHEALTHNQKEDVETDVVDVVMQPGYRVGEKVVRPARVGVAGPA